MNEVDEILQEFLAESYENLDQLDRDFVELETNPSDLEVLKRVFRTIHTIKGTCGFLGFSRLEKLAHVGENCLSRLRDGELRLTNNMASALLAMVDAIREILARLENTGEEGVEEYAELRETLACLAEGKDVAPPTRGAAATPAAAESAPALATNAAPAQPSPAPEPVESAPAPVDQPSPVATPAPRAIEPAPAPAVRAVEPAPAPAVRAVEPAPAPAVRAVEPAPAPAVRAVEPTSPAPSSRPAESAPTKVPGGKGVADANVRVGVDLLDKLMNLVGELVLARNQIVQYAADVDDSAFQATTQRLNLVTTELQEGVMKTRMQPIRAIWGRFPRVVRDLARTCQKQVRLEMEGKETELDRTLIEAIRDPLTHIVRNAVDHGIEGPEDRIAAGKPPEGVLRLRAYHEGGQVNIEITDDGAGINTARLREKAVRSGLLTDEQSRRLSENEAMDLIFHPGLSTAAKVTNVSGRGVGMDVVKTNIERIGGTIDLVSRRGEGTTLKVKIPLTLAIIPALTVTAANQRFAIPQVNLLELVRIGASQRSQIEQIHGTPVYRLRGNLLPLAYLTDVLGLPRTAELEEDDERSINIVVLQADGRPFGLVVDSINDTEEIVVKPLGQQLKALKVYAGATIMGDGQVALILDTLSVGQCAAVIAESRSSSRIDARASEGGATKDDMHSLLIVATRDGGQMAIPLERVARLEEVRRNEVERLGGRFVIQYRGSILPVLQVSDVTRDAELATPLGAGVEGDVPLVVCSDGDCTVGIAVEQILDVVDVAYTDSRVGTRRGCKGVVVVSSKVTEVLDADFALEVVNQRFYGGSARA